MVLFRSQRIVAVEQVLLPLCCRPDIWKGVAQRLNLPGCTVSRTGPVE